MLQHEPNPRHSPLDILNAHLETHGNKVALTLTQHQNQLNVSLRDPEKAFAPLWLWISLFLLGSGLLPLELYFTSAVTIEIAFAGLTLLGISIVGLSTHLSAFLNDSRYNLMTSLKFFMARHKLLTVCAIASLLMFNPLALIIGLSIGIFIDIALYGLLNEIEYQSRRFFDWVVNTLTLDNAENLMRYCWRHPLNLLSMVAGASGALTLFTRFFPQIFPFLFNALRVGFKAVENIVNDMTSPITRGFIPYYILTTFAWLACAVTLPLTLFALPTLGIAGGGWLGLKIWETSYNVLSFCGKKLYARVKPLFQRNQALPAVEPENVPPLNVEAALLAEEDAPAPEVSEESVEIVMEIPKANRRRGERNEAPAPTEYVLRLRPRRPKEENREQRKEGPEEGRQERRQERRRDRRAEEEHHPRRENRRRPRFEAEVDNPVALPRSSRRCTKGS